MRTKLMIGLLVLVLTVLNFGIYEKEQIKIHGETLLLKLAPVDPRSLMQGDYMRLRYAIEDDIGANKPPSQQKHGYLVVLPDQNTVAQFVRFHKGENLHAGEKLLKFRMNYGRLQILPDSFFFQEGHADRYETAQYGVFKIDDSGGHLLVGLADKNRETIRVDTPKSLSSDTNRP